MQLRTYLRTSYLAQSDTKGTRPNALAAIYTPNIDEHPLVESVP